MNFVRRLRKTTYRDCSTGIGRSPSVIPADDHRCRRHSGFRVTNRNW
jgi:hypothetical protein